MKKTYTKPMFYAEEFQLVEHISLNCAKEAFTPHFSNGWVCSIEWKNGDGQTEVMFTTNISGCANSVGTYDASWQDDDLMESQYNELCYNAMAPGPMFSS